MYRQLLIVILILVLTQILSQTRAETVQHSDGLYYLVLSGDATEINRYCSYGDCGSGFPTRIDALNEWVRLMGLANGYVIAPLPPPP